MNVGLHSALEGIRDAASAGAWLRGLPVEAGARLEAIHALLERLCERGGALARPEPQALNDILEALRVAQWRAIVVRLEPLSGRPVPFTPIEWPLLHGALENLAVLRNLYKRVWAQTVRAGEQASGNSGVPDSLAGVRSLMRALDAQSRILALQLRYCCVPAAADWDELCVLARNARRTSFQDEVLDDEVALVKPSTARALFVYPLLLECASLAARVGAEADLVRRLAARLASRVGYRIDHGAPRDNAHGPRMALSADYAVRLDTHRVPGVLAQWRSQWFGDDESARRPFPLPLPEEQALRLLAALEHCWAPGGALRSSGAHPAASATVQSVRLCFGLPKTNAADLRSGGVAVRSDPARADAENRYDYGRWEQNTILRLVSGNDMPRERAATKWIRDGERASRLSDRPDGRTVIARESPTPRVVAGTLIAIGHEAEPPIAGYETGPSVRLGTVEAIEQLPGREGNASRAHWLVARLWAGQAVAVSVRVGESAFFEDAWLLRGIGADCELPCLVMAPGRALGGDPGVLREPGGEAAIRFVSVLDRGPGYERLSMRTESARNAP